eukprot:superscaffoldBa00000398_g4413
MVGTQGALPSVLGVVRYHTDVGRGGYQRAAEEAIPPRYKAHPNKEKTHRPYIQPATSANPSGSESSDGVSPRLAVPPCARLRGGARLRQQQSLALNHHASGRIAGLRMISLFSHQTPLDRAKERFHSDLPPLVTPQQHLQRRLTASAANSKPD